ncbi:hypothetical protein AAC387_Pa12g2050 [Persea americana]
MGRKKNPTRPGEETSSRAAENPAAGEETSAGAAENPAAGEETSSGAAENPAAGEETSSGAAENPAAILKRKQWMVSSKRTEEHVADRVRRGEAIPALKSRLCWIMAHCWYKQLPLPLKSRVDDMGFKDFFSIEPFRVDQYLISALSERWRDETHTFHLPPGELTISLEDMVQCWGLRVVGKPMFSEPEYSNPDRNRVLFRQFFGFRPDAKGAMIPLSWLYSIYCPVKARELSQERLEAQGVPPNVAARAAGGGDAGDGACDSSGGDGQRLEAQGVPPNVGATAAGGDGASFEAAPVADRDGASDCSGGGDGLSRMPLRTASHKRRRDAGIPDLEFDVRPTKKSVKKQSPSDPTYLNSEEAHLRAFLLYLLGTTFFCGSSSGLAMGTLLHYLKDLDKLKDYAWGAAALANLFSSLDNRVRCEKGHQSLGGFVAIMQVWAWEHLSTCRPMQLPYRQDLFPRAARWYPSANMRSFERTLPAEVAMKLRLVGVRHGENEYRYVYDELYADEVLWRPYGEIGEASPAIVREALPLFKKDIWLHAPKLAAKLLMSRVTRQFQDHAMVPPQSPSNTSLLYTYLGWSLKKFKTKHPCTEEIEDWNNGGQWAGQHVVELPHQYEEWWLTTPHRHILPPVYRGSAHFTIKSHFEELEELRGSNEALEQEVMESRGLSAEGVNPQGSRPSASSTPDEWCLYMTVLKELKGVRKELVASQKESTDHCRARKNDMVAHIAEMKAVRDRYEEKINQQDAEIAELQRVVNHYRQELFAQYAESQCTQELYEKEICEITRFYHNKMSASSSAGAPPMPPPRDPPT